MTEKERADAYFDEKENHTELKKNFRILET
jgi:hypothetical protein